MKKLTILFAALFIIPVFPFGVASLCHAQNYYIYTFAGNGTAAYSGDQGPASFAELNKPNNVGTDKWGNVYIADNLNNVIRKVNTSGIISTVAGNGTPGFSGDGGAATAAELNGPSGVAVDLAGNMYIVDNGNSRVRKVNTNGIISTFVGNGTQGFSGDGGLATAAELNTPEGITTDGAGNVYIDDKNNQRIRVVNAAGTISTFAGGGWALNDGGPATAALLDYPYDVASDASGNIYIADWYNNRIRKVNTNGIISTVAGNGTSGYSGDGGPATAAEFAGPIGVAVDPAGDIFISDWNNYRVREVTSNGTMYTVAGNGYGAPYGPGGFSGDGGPATAAEFWDASGVATDGSGNVYIADIYNNRIRELVVPQTYSLAVVNDSNTYLHTVGSPIKLAGDIFNFGLATITSFRLNYNVNGGAITRQYFSPVSLNNLSTYPFSDAKSWTPAAPGNYLLKVWTDSLNGSMANINHAGDSLYVYFTVVDTLSPKMVLFEDYMQASCGTCMFASPNIESVLSSATSFCNSFRYHVNWPGTDYMNNETQSPFVATRVSYYGINTVPYGRIDGTTYANPGFVTDSDISAAGKIGSPFKITINSCTFNPVTNTYNLNASIKAYAPIPENTFARIVVSVDTMKYAADQSTEYPTSSFAQPIGNGGTADSYYPYVVNFPQVAEDMMPGATGALLNPFSLEQTQTINISWQKDHPWGTNPSVNAYDSTFPGEHITIWIQDDQAAGYTSRNTYSSGYSTHAQTGALTTYIYQSASQEVTISDGIKEIAEGVYFNMYPNPANGNTTIDYKLEKEQNISVELFNAFGEKVYESKQGLTSAGKHTFPLNTGQFRAGIYFLRFSTDNTTTVKKLIIAQ